jgi:hypothetical protein
VAATALLRCVCAVPENDLIIQIFGYLIFEFISGSGIARRGEMGRIARMAGVLVFMGIIAIFCEGIVCAQQAAINCKGPLSEELLIGLLKGGVADVRVQAFVDQCGIDFANTPEVEKALVGFGASNGVIATVRKKDKVRLRREEEKLWTESKDGRSAAKLQEYLRRFPDGEHSLEAKEKLTQLKMVEELRTKIRQAKKEGKWQEAEPWLKELTGLVPEDEETRTWKIWETGERARWDSMTLAEAKQEVESLEEKIAQIRKTVETARDTELQQLESTCRSERENAGQVAPQGEYETSAEYEARLEAAKQKQAVVDAKCQADKDQAQRRYTTELEENTSAYKDRIGRLQNRTYLMPGASVQRVGYDADASRFSVTINGEEYWFKIEPSTARDFDSRLGSAKVEQYLGEEHAQERVLVDAGTVARFKGVLRATEEERLRRDELARNTWIDPQTNLMWTLKDNGSDVEWNEAMSYCQQSRLGGFSDWRLPEIGELEGIYDASSKQLYKAKGGVQLSNLLAWSATKQGSDSAWLFNFFNGRRGPTLLDYRSSHRALCVHIQGQLIDVRETLPSAVARNPGELAQLRLKGQRDYFEFTLPKKGEPTKVEDIRLVLTSTDPKKGKFNLKIQADDSSLEKKDRIINEPIYFLVGQNRVRYEVVINWVQKNKAGGYLSIPRDRSLTK